MKKWMIGFSALVALLLLAAYIAIPTKLTISDNIIMKVNLHSGYRCLTDNTKWKKLFENSANKKNCKYKINRILLEGAEVLIEHQNLSVSSIIKIFSLNKDSSIINWTASIENSANPLKRVERYLSAHEIKTNMNNVLENMKRFMEKEENVYDIAVQQTTVKDTLLISTKNVFKNYPSVENIYSLITILKNYIKAHDAKETGYPMLNVTQTDSMNFLTRIAIPINKTVEENRAIEIKRMVAGKILVTKVKGGPYAITKAFNSLKNFLQDHQFSSPAIPFESLITNRLNERDTTKWVTNLYYPIY
jgi:effector-binding domain-containing protein